ncbi:hypothetical protein [Chamaesiphon sp.]|uniref:hypothetical protein n=1 Tax=Chamaesiphon sp. TaxID=2814140 RepID=UPI0035936F8D
MDTQHLNTYLHLIEALLDCAKGEEWLLLQQHEDLIDAELLTVMAQITDRLNAEGNAPAAKFLHYWTVQLTHLLQQNTNEDPAQSRADSYLKLIQTLLGCSKGDEVAILSQHPDLVDEGLVYMMNQVAAQLAAKGSQDTAIYLKHLAAEVNRVGQHPSAGRTQISVPQPNSHDAPLNIKIATANNLHPNGDRQLVTANSTPKSSPPPNSHDTGVATATKLHPDEGRFLFTEAMPTATAAPTTSSPLPNSQIEQLLANISSRLERMEALIGEPSPPSNPLWYMPILAEVETQGWIISSEEVEQLIGTKPHCASGHNSFVRGCWKFVKAGKVGTHSSWRVIKEMATLPSEPLTSEPEGIDLQPDVSPWSENS